MANLKPQVPMMSGGDYIYPVTTIDQVLMEDGERASEAVATKQYVDNRSGIELLWTNPSSTVDFAAQTVSLDLSAYRFVGISTRWTVSYDWGESEVRIFPKSPGVRYLGYVGAGSTVARRIETISDSGVQFGVGYNGSSQQNSVAIPVSIYGIK